jgi:hypothetical protein
VATALQGVAELCPPWLGIAENFLQKATPKGVREQAKEKISSLVQRVSFVDFFENPAAPFSENY